MRRTSRFAVLTPALVAVAALTGCGGGGGGGASSLSHNVGVLTADYLVLDLASGEVETRSTIADLSTAATWRTGRMVFRAVAAADCTTGSPLSGSGSWGHLTNEAQSTVAVPKYYLGVFEVTKAQWRALAGTTPWTTVSPAAAAGGQTIVDGDGTSGVDATLPAFAISLTAALDAVTAWNSGHAAHLAVPDAGQWERACRAGSAGAFAWGDSRDDVVAGQYAQVFETTAGVQRPRAVGSRSANAYGFYDMHGNVWEWTRTGPTSGEIRGGSWSDPLSAARSANHVALDVADDHSLVGVRLVLIP